MNRKDIRFRFRRSGIRNTGAALCGILTILLAGAFANAGIPSYDRVRVMRTPVEIADAELTNQNGEGFRLSQLRGRVAFVYFGYTNCPDVCPLAMENLRQLHESGAVDNSRLSYVMISVDGERDTPEVMKTFLAKFSTDFIGLTGEPARVKPVAKQFSVSFFDTGHNGHGDDYAVSHSPQVFVMDPSGALRAELYQASVESMAGVANALLAE